MVTLADIIFGFLSMFLAEHGKKLPSELVTAAQSAVDAWAAHRADAVTKENFEAQRR